VPVARLPAGGVGATGKETGVAWRHHSRRPAGRAATVVARAPAYDEGVVRLFVIATMSWGVVGFLMGDLIAWQLAYPPAEPGPGVDHLRPAAARPHLGGDLRLRRQRVAGHLALRGPADLPRAAVRRSAARPLLFWGYQLFIVLAASGYVLGVTQSREYAEPEWYVDLWLTAVWVLYLVIFLGTILRRREPHIYVSNWYYLAFIVTIAVLHIGNNLAVPVSLFGAKSYSLFAACRTR
jgi:cytochrome c oxidase cbb3-type subunit 1